MKLLQLPSDEFKSDVRKCYVGVGFIREILEWKYGDDTNDDHSLKKLCQMLEVNLFFSEIDIFDVYELRLSVFLVVGERRWRVDVVVFERAKIGFGFVRSD